MNLGRPRPADPYQGLPHVDTFSVRSSDISNGVPMPARFAFFGAAPAAENLSPNLAWSDVPAGTKSFVVTCYDPDAPTPSGFWHWALVDLAANVHQLPTGVGTINTILPDNAFHIRNDRGTPDYRGPFPPEGDRPHRYYFVVHAVDIESLCINDRTSPALLSVKLATHTLARAKLVTLFQR